jgi:hypothetical protein
VRSAKIVYQEVLLPIIGHKHEHYCVRIAENLNTAAFFPLPQMKMFMQEEVIHINMPEAVSKVKI